MEHAVIQSQGGLDQPSHPRGRHGVTDHRGDAPRAAARGGAGEDRVQGAQLGPIGRRHTQPMSLDQHDGGRVDAGLAIGPANRGHDRAALARPAPGRDRRWRSPAPARPRKSDRRRARRPSAASRPPRPRLRLRASRPHRSRTGEQSPSRDKAFNWRKTRGKSTSASR